MNILTLHKIVKTAPEEWADINLVFFNQILKFIHQKNLEMTTINNWKINKSGDIALTFDDGFSSDFEIVFPLLQRMNTAATFFIVPDFVDKNGYMSWQNIKQLSDSGMEIASHSKTHQHLNTLSNKKLFLEFKNSKMIIEQMIGQEVHSFAYPYGSCSKDTHKLAFQAGYKNVCNSKPGLCSLNTNILSRNSMHSNLKFSDLNRK